jgi:hypothetical protein
MQDIPCDEVADSCEWAAEELVPEFAVKMLVSIK